jgi:hypothetical protein
MHIVPTLTNSRVQTTFMDGSYQENTYEEIYPVSGSQLILSLIQANGRSGFIEERHVMLPGVKKAKIHFSRSGQYLAIYNYEKNILSVYYADDIFDCFNQIEQQSPMLFVEFQDKLEVCRIVFDLDDQAVGVVTDK